MANEKTEAEIVAGRAKMFKTKLVWVEKDSTRTPIAQMSDNHLKHAIRLIEEGIRTKQFWRTVMLQYLKEERHYRALINKKGVRTCQHRSSRRFAVEMKDET